MKRYKPLFREAFMKKDVSKAITLTSSILGKKLGDKIFVPSIVSSFEKAGQGHYQGVHCTTASGKQIRYNWKFSSSSGVIDSVDVWFKKGLNPDITIDLNGLNIVHIINTVAEAIKNKVPNEYIALAEDVSPRGGKQISKDIAASINRWVKDMGLGEDKLKTTRMSYLHKDFEFWRSEVAEDNPKGASLPTFTSYMLMLFQKNNIENIFIKKIKVKKATHDIVDTDPQNQKKFNDALYAMSLQDTIEYVEASVRAVIRGYENALVVCGTSGIGKSRLVLKSLKDEGAQFKVISGGVQNPSALFTIFKNNNKDKFILVFDDVDNVMQANRMDLLKAATSPDKKRTITFYDTKHTDAAMGKKNDPVIEDFKSRIIIITNKPKKKLPQALISRTAPIEINASIPDVIDNIRVNVDTIMPDFKQATKAIKLEVLDFIEETLKDNIQQMDYRLFERCIIYRLDGNPAWKKFCLPILRTV